MPIVRISLFEGRTQDQKRAMSRRITDAISEEAKVPPENVTIIFDDMSPTNFAKAGVMKCDQ